MADSEQIKNCPNCESDDSGLPANGRRLCYVCGFSCKEELWNALPRREEFHADLKALRHDISVNLMRNFTAGKLIDDLAAKYAPKEADE